MGFSTFFALLRARLKEEGLGSWRRAASDTPCLTEVRIWSGRLLEHIRRSLAREKIVFTSQLVKSAGWM